MFVSIIFDDGTPMKVLRVQSEKEIESRRKELEEEYYLKLVGTKKESGGFIFSAKKKRKPIWKSGALVERGDSVREKTSLGFGKVHIDMGKAADLNFDGEVKIRGDDDKKYIWE